MVAYTDDIKAMNLWEKISQISCEIEYLQKDDKVGYGNNSYKAISIEKVMTAVADKMNKYGVVIYPLEQVYSRKDEEVTKKDGTTGINRISDVDVKYEVVNIHEPSQKIVTVSSGTGVDTQDKGIGKAMTYAYKNMIIKLFAIAIGDDTDKIHSDDYTNNLLGNSNTNNSKPKTRTEIIFELGNKMNITPKTLVDRCQEKYGVADIEKLSDAQYQEIYTAMGGK